MTTFLRRRPFHSAETSRTFLRRQWEEVDQDMDNAVLGLTGPGEVDTDPLGLVLLSTM